MSESAATRALRLLDLVPYLNSHPGVSVAEIAEEFAISRADVIKDLNLIFLCGLPGYTPLELIDISFDEESVNLHDPQNLGTPRRLTESEALSLRIALQALAELLPANHKDRTIISNLTAKMRSIFQSRIPDGALTYSSDRQRLTINNISQAISKNKQISIVYYNKSKDESKTRDIDPFRLIVEEKRVLLHAWCHLSGGLRSFDTANIESLEILDRPRMTSTEEKESGSKMATVRWINSQRSFAERYPSIARPGEPTNDFDFFQEEWLIRSAISYFDEIEVLEPADIRSVVAERCKRALELYSSH